MTLFKAKGLEFDTVIIPGLAEARRGDDNDLLRWRARRGGLLLATARARDGDDDPVYGYLKWLAADGVRARARPHPLRRRDARAPAPAPHRNARSPTRTANGRRRRKGSALAKLWDALADARGAVARREPTTKSTRP